MKATDFIKEIDADDQDAIDSLKKQIDPADVDGGDLEKGFGDKHVSLINQVHKVKDSQGNPNPVNTVTTSDGGKFKIKGWQADLIMQMLTGNYNQRQKMEFTKDVNSKKDMLGALLGEPGPKEMVLKFKELVNPEMQAKSAYESKEA